MEADEILARYKQYGIDVSESAKLTEESGAAPGGGPAAGASQNPPRAPKTATAVVWKLHSDQTMEPVKVSLGITDHSYTEVPAILKGALKEGDEVIIRSVVPKGQTLSGLRR
jgi:hypothetical protein